VLLYTASMNINLAISLFILIASAAGRFVPGEPLDSISHHPVFESELNFTTSRSLTRFDYDGPVTAVEGASAWDKSVQRGAKLLQGMKTSDKEAGQLYSMGDSAESPYNGDLHDTLESWDYRDNAEGMKLAVDKDCNMDSKSILDGQWLKKTMDELGLGTKSKGKGGPNECFQIEHYNSAVVILNEDGKRPPKDQQYYKAPCGADFRITGAEHTVGVNGGKQIYLLILRWKCTS
jgi:hypothetical protein